MGTIIEFRLLFLDSSNAESPIHRSTKVVISMNLTTNWHNHLLFFFFCYLSKFFYFIFHLFTENRRYRLFCIAIATVVFRWDEWIKKYLFVTYEIEFNNYCLLWQTLKSEWCLLKRFRIELFIFSMYNTCLLIRAIRGLLALEILNDLAPIAE